MARTEAFEDKIKAASILIKESSRICFLGGAGVSTASGIPDFRGPKGLYRNPDPEFADHEPEYYLSKECLEEDPATFYRFYRKKMDTRNAEPNIVHRKLAELEADGKMAGIVTQNIDSLHEKAGSTKVAKIHGTADECYCPMCGRRYPGEAMFADTDGDFPRCSCGEALRPSIVLYNEMLPEDEMKKAYGYFEGADCIIICGTSCALPHIRHMIKTRAAESSETFTIVINETATPIDWYADVVFREDMSMVWEKISWK